MKKICLWLILSGSVIYSGNINFFPERQFFFSASALEFRHYLYTGTENRRTVNHGNIGLEFPLVKIIPDSSRALGAGIAAATHLVMYPKNQKFAVDNFYATLAVYAETECSANLTFRLYPVYHVSGHLADGSPNDSALAHARAVSSEMVKLESSFTPFRFLTFAAGYGYYYHVCAQQGLTDRFDLSARWEPVSGRWYRPFLTVSGQVVHLSEWRSGVDIEAGVSFVNKRSRGVAVDFRFFNRPDPGYYFDKKEKSVGVQIDFMP
jgi:hypothetical protein